MIFNPMARTAQLRWATVGPGTLLEIPSDSSTLNIKGTWRPDFSATRA